MLISITYLQQIYGEKKLLITACMSWRYLRDEYAGVVNTERMTCVAVTANDAQTKRTTSLQYSQRLRTDSKQYFTIKPSQSIKSIKQ